MSLRTTDRRVAIGTFELRDKADAAFNALEAAGFARSDIGVIAKRTAQWDDLDFPESDQASASEHAASGAVAGAAAGAGVGGLWALGIAAGLLPAIGPVVAGGLLGSLMASAAAGAAAGAGSARLCSVLGMSEEEASFYSSELQLGRIVVTVRAGDRYPDAVRILREHGATLSEPMESNNVVGKCLIAD
ncbi:MAG: hypothetical protein U0872_13550 [Planctomycetaceae bacterium]